MKLIHCADLHLDSPMESNLPQEKARERRSELRATFSRLVRLADETGVSGILIAGDLFDSSSVKKSSEKYVLELIEKHPSVEFYYLSGNHDEGSALKTRESLPENLHLFSNAWTSYDLRGVRITGSERPDPDTLQLERSQVNIVMLHGQITGGRGSGEDLIAQGRYRGKQIDYLALGHLHEYRAAKLDARATVCYSGCLEGRGFDECGQKGYVLLEIENGRIEHRFVPFACRRLHTVQCDISTCKSTLSLENALLDAVGAISHEDLVKVLLVGSTCPTLQKDMGQLLNLLSERFYFAKLRDESRILIRPEDYALDISLRGEFVRQVLASDLNEVERERVIACGLRALEGEEVGF